MASAPVDPFYRTLFAPPGVQLILCAYCVLRDWTHDDLSAPYWRWYWNDRPGASVTVGGRSVALAADRVLLIPPHTAFASRTRATVGHLYCHFTTGIRATDVPAGVLVRRITPNERQRIRWLVSRIRTADPAKADASIGFAMQSLVASAISDVEKDQWITASDDSAVWHVLAIMHDQPALPMDNRTLADAVAVSPNTLLRRFKRATGTTPHRYLARLRVDLACIALRSTADSLEAIAERCGFCDRFHMSRAFRQHLDISPASLRRLP